MVWYVACHLLDSPEPPTRKLQLTVTVGRPATRGSLWRPQLNANTLGGRDCDD